ncbi:substrate-binding periplasmic protein [Massilia sp. DWR3-1-1]|uniref:substrate-binding periplasmic protein n=1 Tax=Massilia sp. DWR3-1-1 TaxID=2804559 RepID=UPI003CE9B508
MHTPGNSLMDATTRSLLVLALGALACTTGRAGATITVPIMAQESVAPKWILDQGKPQGMCADLLAAIEQRDPRLHFTGYDRARSLGVIEQGLERGSVWAACALVESPVRRRIAVRASVPLYEARYRLAALAGDTEAVADLDQLARRKVLINTARGSGYIPVLKARGIEVDDSTGDSLVNLRKTLHGHGRYTYLNESSLFYYIRSARLEQQLTVLPTVFDPGLVYFWISNKADPALAPAIEAALQKLKASGELARIYTRWTAPDRLSRRQHFQSGNAGNNQANR